MTKALLICSAGTILFISCEAATAPNCLEKSGLYSYSYVELNPVLNAPVFGRSFQIDLRRLRVLYGGHVGDGFRNTYCNADDSLFCFKSGRFSFAVPKAPLSLGQTWTSFGRIYRTKATQRLALMGVRTNVFEIVGDPRFPDTDQTYFYSQKRGLLAIKSWSKASKSYLLQFSDSGIGYPVKRCTADPKGTR
jgi:hypothetical protein